MSIEITLGGTCRDVSLLPTDEAELKSFFNNHIVPAMWEDFRVNVRSALAVTGTRDADVMLTTRGCEFSGGVIIRL